MKPMESLKQLFVYAWLGENTIREKAEAAENAIQAGAGDVRNDLIVED